jgi:hypothetical protein
VAQSKLEIACREFERACDQIEVHYQSTSPVRIRVEHGLCTVRVYRDGVLWQVIDKPTGRDLRDPFYGNR